MLNARTNMTIMLQFVSAWLFETENLTAFRIDSGHDVTDGAVLAGRVHPLKNQQQGVAAGCVIDALSRAQRLNVFFEGFLIFLLRFAKGLHKGRPLTEFDLFSGPHSEIL